MSPSFHVQSDWLRFALAGPQWTRRKRDASGEVVMCASRGYERVEEDKTAGCMADGLHCNIWARVQSPSKLSYELIKGALGRGGQGTQERISNARIYPLHSIQISSQQHSYGTYSYVYVCIDMYSYVSCLYLHVSVCICMYFILSTLYCTFNKD